MGTRRLQPRDVPFPRRASATGQHHDRRPRRLIDAEIARRIEAAGAAAGIERRLTGHSGRVGLAVELTTRGASTADVMLAGGWQSAAMVTRYAAWATAERGAVARFL